MTDSPPKSPAPTRTLVGWGPAAIVFVELMLYSAVQAPVPSVNEPQYLGKAAHLWNPDWAAGDLFMESSNPHLFFYVVVGWLTRFLSLEATAWVSRLAGYALLAVGWTVLAERLCRSRLAAIVSAAIFLLLAAIGNLSGEWLVGGIEGKVFAYGLLFLAIANWLGARLIISGMLLGGAVSFHPIVGGWGLVCIAFAEGFARVLHRSHRHKETQSPDRATYVLAGLGFLIAALPGAIPAAATLTGASASDSATATFIQVFWRLRHHLDPTRFPPINFIAYAALFAAWLVLVTNHFRRTSSDVGDRPDHRWTLFVVATVAIAIVGVAAGWHAGSAWQMPLRDFRSTLLKFYPFRFADVFVPLAFSLAASQALIRVAQTKLGPGWRTASTFAIAVLALGGAILIERPDRNPSRLTPQRLAAWKDVAEWSRDHTPPGTVLVTPSRMWGFKWFSQRAEYVNFKDSPQETAGLLEWKRRLDVLQDWWAASPDGRYTNRDLARLGTLTGSDYLVTYAFPGQFAVPPIYENGEFRVYFLNPSSR